MPRPLILLIAFSLFSATVHGQEAMKPSPAVTRILDEAVRAVKRNRVDFDKANQKPLGEARKALDELSTKLIKDGKAEEATAVLRQVGTLEADVMRMANAPPPVAGGGAVPQKPLLERLAGKWDHPNAPLVMVCDATGKVEQFWRTGRSATAGTLRVIGQDEVEARFDDRFYRMRVIGDDLLVVRLYKPDGKEYSEGVIKFRVD